MADYESVVRFAKLKMANPIWLTKILKNSHNFYKNWYTGVFEVADYESVVRFTEFKMVDTICRTKILKNLQLL